MGLGSVDSRNTKSLQVADAIHVKALRPYNAWTFLWIMFSMNTCIPLFLLGPTALNLGLSPEQALVGSLLGATATALVMILNGVPGVKYGVPYPVQLKPSWGAKGSHIAVVLRGIVGAGWYGIEAYCGSLAAMMILLYVVGYAGRRPEVIATAAYNYLPLLLVAYVIAAAYVTYGGLKAIGRLANIAGPVMVLYFIWLLAYLRGIGTGAEPPTGVSYFSPEFATYLAVQTNFWATVALNISDLSRGLPPGRKGYKALVLGALGGIVVGQVAGTMLGYYLALYAGHVTPQEIILYTAPGSIAVLLGQLFALLAPFSTDVTANIPALNNILTATFKLRPRHAAIVCGLIGFLLAPWWAARSGPGIVYYVTAFCANYGVILGPIAGIMLADYYIVKKMNYDLRGANDGESNGYWCRKGFSLNAILSFTASVILCYIVSIATGTLVWTGPIPWPTPLSWYLGVATAFALYTILARILREH